MALTNEPSTSALGSLSDHRLLTLILTELRLQTFLAGQAMVREQELDGLRAEIMNDLDIADTESTTAVLPANQ